MQIQEQVLVEKKLQSSSKAFHLTVYFNNVSFPTLKKAKRTTMLRTRNYLGNTLFMMS